MRQSIGTTWIIGLMVLFILIFTAYIIATIDYSKTIEEKNDVIAIVEKYEGFTTGGSGKVGSIQLINNYLQSNGYNTMGSCRINGNVTYGSNDLNVNNLVNVDNGGKYYYCVTKYNGTKNSHYYQVTLFYNFSLPVIGNSATMSAKGTTSNFISADSLTEGG